jgi:iron complex outermembrane receptor protein
VRLSPVFSRLFLLALSGLIPVTVLAEPVEFDLPAQPADRALLAFSRQAKVEILFSSDDLHPARSSGVTGRYEPAEALTRLLQGTGFAARSSGQGKFVVMTARPPAGSIKGKLLDPAGGAARGIHVTIADTRQTAVTDEGGAFEFTAVPPGTHRLVASGTGYRTLQITGVKVAAGLVQALEAKTLRTVNEPTRLEPVVVEGGSSPVWRFDRSEASPAPPTAAGNLDLRRTENDALPYTIYGRDQIARSGVVNLNEFIQRNVLDSDAATRSPEQSPGSDFNANGSFVAGSTNLNLRSQGLDETVVLVNGRRLPEVLVSVNGPTQAQQPDVNFIPLSLVQRVEVLPISASAIYSGNPVGGVINIVLRPDANFSEVTTTYTNALGGFDAPQSTVSLQHGETLLDGALRVRLNATFTGTVPPTEEELGYIQAALRAGAVQPDPLYRATPNIRSDTGSPLFGPGSPSVTSVAPGADGTGGLAAFAGRQGVASVALFDSPGGMANSSASVDFPYGRRQQGASYFGSATYDVLPWLQLGLDGIYTRTVGNRGYNVFTGDLKLAAGSAFNPFGQDVDVTLNEIAPRLGEGYSESRVDFSSIVFGVMARLPAEWRVSLDTQYGHSITQYRGLAGVDPDSWQELVDEGLYNPLRDTQVHGPPPEFYDHVLKYYGSPGTFVTLGNYDTLDTALRITNQSLSLPTGTGTVNFGGDYRRNHLAPYTEEQRFGDGTLAADSFYLSGRTLQQLSLFGEMQAPLLPSRRLPGWIRDVQADMAVRYTAAASAQETSMAPTGGLKIDFAGGLSLRGTIATSNRLPPANLSGTAVNTGVAGGGGGDVTIVTVKDPLLNNQITSQVLASDAINPNLHPEAAVTRTVGLVFQRGKVHQFRAAVDFVDTQKSGEIIYLDQQDVVNLEAFLPGRVTRAPPAAGAPNGVGPIVSVLTGSFNLAYRHSQNWSTSFDYAWTECLGGRLELYGRWLYFQRYLLKVLPNTPVVDELGRPDGTAPGLLKHRMNFGAAWFKRDYGFGLDGHYFYSRMLPLDQQADQHGTHVDPYWQFDAFVQSDLARWLPWKNPRFGLRGQLRVNNLFNDHPPKYADDPSGAGVQSYGDWRGQVYSLSLTVTF